MAEYDVIIIGGNTPALVAATYLSKDAGQKVLILEKSPFIGGTAMTVEMTPGFKFHPAATGEFYVHPKVNKELQLEKYGLEEIPCNPTLTTSFGNGEYLRLFPDHQKTAEEIARFSEHDAKAYLEFIRNWGAVGQMFGLEQMNEAPSMAQFVSAMSASPEMERMCRDMLFGTTTDILDNYFENDYVKAAFLTLNEGNVSGPSSGNFFFNLGRILHPWGTVKGGLKMVAEALEACALDHGVEIRRESEVTKILVKDGAAYGVEVNGSEQIGCKVVVSELEWPKTFFDLTGTEFLPDTFVRNLNEIKYECGGVTLNLALDELPDFGFPEECYNGFFGITKPGYDYQEEAFAEYKCKRIPERMCSMTYIPSYIEPGVYAPEGKHVLVGYAFPINYFLKDREWDEETKKELLDKWIDSLNEFAPGIKDHVIYADGYTPKELEEKFGMTHGDLGHGTLRWYHEFGYRPMPGYANYRVPIKNLYMAGQNVHPLSGLGGVGGFNVARAIINDYKLDAAAEGGKDEYSDRW
ncbi:MAG: phytoene desaturase family protein [Coriobacteriales bacterium]